MAAPWSAAEVIYKELPMNAADLLPAQFNVASHCLDRNVTVGRGGSTAFVVGKIQRFKLRG